MTKNQFDILNSNVINRIIEEKISYTQIEFIEYLNKLSFLGI